MAPSALPYYGLAPDFTGIVHWINTPPLSLKQCKGKVVLIDFWTYTCINCLRTLPSLKQWHAKYKETGLIIIGVHTPEFTFEKDPSNVEAAVKRLRVTYPIAQDNDYQTWRAYQNRYWPAHFLIDQESQIRYVHFGEGAYISMENAIRQLLNLHPLYMENSVRSTRKITPEIYLGNLRASHYTKDILLKPNHSAFYSYSHTLKENEVGLKGDWEAKSECITAQSNASYIELHFIAKRVYLVLSNNQNQAPLQVFLDGKLTQTLNIDEDKNYDVANATYGHHMLSLKIPKGVSAYAFTFGDE